MQKEEGVMTEFPEVICALCEQQITEAEAAEPLAPQFVEVGGRDVQVHSDCYFEGFGEEIDQHPIRRPTRPR